MHTSMLACNFGGVCHQVGLLPEAHHARRRPAYSSHGDGLDYQMRPPPTVVGLRKVAMRWRTLTVRSCVACQLLQGTSCRTKSLKIVEWCTVLGCRIRASCTVMHVAWQCERPNSGAESTCCKVCGALNSRAPYRGAWRLLIEAKREA